MVTERSRSMGVTVYVVRSAAGEYLCRGAWSSKLGLASKFLQLSEAARRCPSGASIYQLVFQVLRKDGSAWLSKRGMSITYPPIEFTTETEAATAIKERQDREFLKIEPVLMSVNREIEPLKIAS